MKLKLILTLLFLFAGLGKAFPQIEIRTDYIGRSHFKDEENNRTGGKGGAMVYSAAFRVPLSVKTREDKRMTLWAVSLDGSYTDFDNRNMPRAWCPGEILNSRLGGLFLTPVGHNQSIIASLGIGIYAPHTNLSKITFDEVMFDGAAALIWHLRHNLDVGVGLALNNSFGYPMAFPAFVLQWRLDGRFEVDVQMLNAASVSVGMNVTERFRLSLVFEANGSMAIEKREGRKMMFSHSYMITGFRPEFRLGKMITIPVTAGITADRTAFYEEATLKAFFKAMDREYDPRFTIAPYASVALRIGF